MACFSPRSPQDEKKDLQGKTYDILTDAWRNNPQGFLMQLKTQSLSAWSKAKPVF